MGKRAFTLIELLVVIAIIAILAAILFPVFAQAKEAAKKTACLSQAKQTGLSAMMYATDNDDMWVPYSYGLEGDFVTSPGWGDGYGLMYWNMNLYPYMKNYDLLVCPTKDYTNNSYAAFINGKQPDPPNVAGQGQLRVSWCWNAIAEWTEATKVTPGFVTTGKTGFVNAPFDYWEASPVSGSAIEDTAGSLWLTEGVWSDIGSDYDSDYGVKLNLSEANQYWRSSTGQRFKGRRVRARHTGAFNSVYGDGHSKNVKWGSSTPAMWTIQQD